MPTARAQLAQLEATCAGISPPRRLALAAELLEWTVANFATPIADESVRDLLSRAAATVREAVGRGLSAVPARQPLYAEIGEAITDAVEHRTEPGSFDLLISYHLCFDELAPEITPRRLVVILDHCHQADYVRYIEPESAFAEVDGESLRGQEIRAYQHALLRRYAE